MSASADDFLFLCRCLSVDDCPAALSALQREIRTGEIDWRQIAELAADHFLTPALWVSLSRKRLESHLPEDARDFLDYVHGLNVERNGALKAEVLRLAARLNEVGVEPILLKGAINLFDSAYGEFGARMMTDIDILIPETEIAHALASLQKLGYRPVGEGAWKAHTYSALCRPGANWSLDVHRYLGYQRDIVAPADVGHEAVPLETQGVSPVTDAPGLSQFLSRAITEPPACAGAVPDYAALRFRRTWPVPSGGDRLGMASHERAAPRYGSRAAGLCASRGRTVRSCPTA